MSSSSGPFSGSAFDPPALVVGVDVATVDVPGVPVVVCYRGGAAGIVTVPARLDKPLVSSGSREGYTTTTKNKNSSVAGRQADRQTRQNKTTRDYSCES